MVGPLCGQETVDGGPTKPGALALKARSAEFFKLGMFGVEEDPEILQWAAEHGRVVVSHDVNTMSAFAYERLEAGLPMSGLILASNALSIGLLIDEIRIIVQCATLVEFEGKVLHLPL